MLRDSLKSPGSMRGQSLLEVLVAVGIGAILVVGAAGVIVPALLIDRQATPMATETALESDLMDSVRAWSEGDWHNILGLATGTANTYYLNTSSSPYTIGTGTSTPTFNGYRYERTMTVNSSYVSGTLANFPVLISNTYGWLAASSSGGLVQNAQGYDVVFTSDAGCTVKLNWETESYASFNGAVNYWVQVPSVSDSSGATFYLCYDNPSIISDQSNRTATWSAENYAAVWHLPNGTTLTENDSTVNGNNGTPVNGPTAAGGEIYGGANLVSASTQYVTVGNGINPSAITISGWIKATSLANAYEGTFCRDNGTSFACLFLKSNGKLALYVVAGGMVDYDGTGANTLSAGTWYDVAMTYDSVNGLKGYVNGSLDGSAAANGALTTGAAASRLGSDPANASREFNGVIDEMRVASVAFSPSWILTEYNTESNPNAFTGVGSQTAPSGGGSSSVQYLTIGTSTYFRYFYLNDVYRGSGNIVLSGGVYDPSTKLVTVVAGMSGNPSSSIALYLTRHGDQVYDQTDWSGGGGAFGPSTSTNSQFATSSNIDYSTTTGSIYVAIPGY